MTFNPTPRKRAAKAGPRAAWRTRPPAGPCARRSSRGCRAAPVCTRARARLLPRTAIRHTGLSVRPWTLPVQHVGFKHLMLQSALLKQANCVMTACSMPAQLCRFNAKLRNILTSTQSARPRDLPPCQPGPTWWRRRSNASRRRASARSRRRAPSAPLSPTLATPLRRPATPARPHR